MEHPERKRLRLACYATNLSTSVMCNLTPILLLTFRELYGISYSLLGLLMLMNFLTQLCVDLLFSFYSHRFPISLCVKGIPYLTMAGLLCYALVPLFLPAKAFVGLLLGTVIFSASGGLVEVLLSPVVAAIPGGDPEKEVSRLHSVYAWGAVAMILISTEYLLLVGKTFWQGLPLFFSLIPLTGCLLFLGVSIPKIDTPKHTGGGGLWKDGTLWLCIAAIFFGGAAECTMAQWCSGYLERALGIPKVWGDLLGMALFSLTLGLGRTLYTLYGRNITKVLLLGASGALVCYLAAALTALPLVGLGACALAGFCVSMLWPGCLLVCAQRLPHGGVFVYAMMAAGGDLGAALGPQLIGWITDGALSIPALRSAAAALALEPEVFGMKLGMLVAALFPLTAAVIYWRLHRTNAAAGWRTGKA